MRTIGMRKIGIVMEVPRSRCDNCQAWKHDHSIYFTCPFRKDWTAKWGKRPVKACREAELPQGGSDG